MADDFSRTWVDDVDDLDAEAMNDLEARQEARVGGVGGGIELGYASTGTTFTTTSTAAAGVDVTALSVTVVVGARPIMVKVRADLWDATGGLGGVLFLREDGGNVGRMAGTDNPSALAAERRRAPAAGSHTYNIRATNLSAGTVTITADDGLGNNYSPMAIQVVEV